MTKHAQVHSTSKMCESRYSGHWTWFQTEGLGDEPLYCEASHAPEDVICSGSEDEYYESATARRLHYEAQALRYLDGEQPFLLSASLKGPFTKESGWTNPWRSKRAKAAKSNQTPTKPTSKEEIVIPGTTSHILEVDEEVSEEEADRFEELRQMPRVSRYESHEPSSTQATSLYPLPSPGSTHAPSVVSNPYMDSSTLKRVQSWRDDVKTTAASKEPFWAPNADQSNQVGTKKRPSNSDWLRKQVSKRAKLDTEASSSINSPVEAVVGNRLPLSRPSISAKTTMGSSTNDEWTNENDSAIQRHESPDCADNDGRKSKKPLTRQIVSQIASPEDIPMPDASLPSRLKPKSGQGASPAILAQRKQLSQSAALQTALDQPSSGASFGGEGIIPQDPMMETESPRQVQQMWEEQSSKQEPSSSQLKSMAPQKLHESSDSDSEDTNPDDQSTSTSADDHLDHVTELETQQDNSFLFRTRAKHGKPASPEAHQPAIALRAASSSSLSSLSSYLSSPPDSLANSDEEQLPIPPADTSDGDSESTDDSEITDDDTEIAAIDVKVADKEDLQANNASPTGRHDFSLSDTSSLTSLESSLDSEENADFNHPSYLSGNSQNEEETISKAVVSTLQEEGLIQNTQHDLARANLFQQLNSGNNVIEQDEEQGEEVTATHMGLQQHTQSPWMKQSQEIVYLPQELASTNDESQRRHSGYSAAHLQESYHEPVTASRTPVEVSFSRSQGQRAMSEHNHPQPQTSQIQQDVPSQTAGFLGLDIIASQALSAVRSLFPWSDNDAHLTLPPSQISAPTSSPDKQLLSESFDRSEPLEEPQELPPRTDSHVHRPSTPDTAKSAISELTSSIKPFSNFLTLSPIKQWKPKRISLASGSHLPSTQLLIDTATSNPWTDKSSTKADRRVSFAPLPDEQEKEVDPDANKENEEVEARIHVRTSNRSHKKAGPRTRAASPPLAVHSDDLQDHDNRFAAHFQAMTKNNRIPRLGRRLLPSASQQVPGSPAVEAMAEAFIEAEQTKSASIDGISSSASPLGQDQEAVPPLLNEESVDDVSAVIDNLGDFLNAWDVDAELADARPTTLPAPGASQMTGLEINAWSA